MTKKNFRSKLGNPAYNRTFFLGHLVHILLILFAYLTVTLVSRTFTHVNSAGLEVKLWRHFGMTFLKEVALDGGTVLVRVDTRLPVSFTRGHVLGHVTR